METNISDAIAYAARLHALYIEQSGDYRSEFVNVQMFFVAGVAVSLAFWMSLARRARQVLPMMLFLGAGTAVTLTFQLYWYQYSHLASRQAEEYRQQAEKLMSGEDEKPFSVTWCDAAGNVAPPPISEEAKENLVPISWRLRKRSEVAAHWNRADHHDCTKVEPMLLVCRQLNVWTLLILLTGLSGLAAVWRTRTGPDDNMQAPRQ